LSSSPGAAPRATSESPGAPLIETIAAALIGDASSVAGLSAYPPDEVLAEAERHGVVPLLAERFAQQGVTTTVAGRVHARARLVAAADLIRDAELRQLVGRVQALGIRALIVKGGQLAYSCYARPDLRPRLDTDLFVALDDRDRAHDALRDLGYERRVQSDGDLLTYQAPYVKTRQGAAVHIVDLHWRLVNPQPFGRLLDFDDASREATPLPALPGAEGLSAVHALLLACVHRVAHHHDADLLIWLYDLHLLCARMNAADWTRFTALGRERGVAAICRHSLALAHARFGSAVPGEVLMHGDRGANGRERSAEYLEPQPHVLRVYRDLQALPRWTERWRLMRQHLFPPARYMRRVYAPSSHAPLPFLYAVRALRGARKWMARES
jgi:hypothetical protein